MKINSRPQKFRKPVVGFIGYVAILDTDNQSYHAGDTSTDTQINNKPQWGLKSANSQRPCREDS